MKLSEIFNARYMKRLGELTDTLQNMSKQESTCEAWRQSLRRDVGLVIKAGALSLDKLSDKCLSAYHLEDDADEAD